LGAGGIMEKLAAWAEAGAEAGADDAMLPRREKAIFGFFYRQRKKEEEGRGMPEQPSEQTNQDVLPGAARAKRAR
jgi:hypothetical protein